MLSLVKQSYLMGREKVFCHIPGPVTPSTADEDVEAFMTYSKASLFYRQAAISQAADEAGLQARYYTK